MNLTEQDDFSTEDEREEKENKGREDGWLHRPQMVPALLGVIVLLLICIIVLLLLMSSREKRVGEGADSVEKLQQNITDYAEEQKQQDSLATAPGTAIVVTPSKEEAADGEEDMAEEPPESDEPLTAQDDDKTAVVVDIEDEDDVSYSKEFILNEALPYFEANNQEAVWDLAHLKRYVKLSTELKGTDSYYYRGDVNSAGKPDGKGLAIYENNSYYYGEWSDGMRSGEGRWFRFYIGQKNKDNANGVYMSHSYAGLWANNLPNGQGAEHYDVDTVKLQDGRRRILQNVVGNFTNGLYDGEMYANTVDYTGNVEEWDGVATKGVFTLWRDMSAIGECSVWRKTDDHSLCLDIDKSENKNQGIRELLKLQ